MVELGLGFHLLFICSEISFSSSWDVIRKLDEERKKRMVVGVTASLSHSVAHVHLQFRHRTKNERGLDRVFHGHKYCHRHCNSFSTTTNSCTATTSGDGGGKLEVAEIKEKCEKWQWKGQYSINYFVSHSNSNPPLLLVHGFGASIPHWRRLVFFSTSSPIILSYCYLRRSHLCFWSPLHISVI